MVFTGAAGVHTHLRTQTSWDTTLCAQLSTQLAISDRAVSRLSATHEMRAVSHSFKVMRKIRIRNLVLLNKVVQFYL